MSLYDNFGGKLSGMSTGGRRILGGQGNQKPAAEVEQEQRASLRAEMLTRWLPDLANANPSMIGELAWGTDSDDEMMTAALGMMTPVQIQNMTDVMKGLSKDEQRGLAQLMPQAKRAALEDNGWTMPEADGKGWFDTVKGWGATAARPVAWTISKGAQLPVISQGLSAMDWAAEEAGRVNRVAPQMQSGKDLLEQTGLSQEQLLQQTGIATPGADVNSDPMSLNMATQLTQLLTGNKPSITEVTPGDIWKAVQVWDSVGHEGDDDYLPQLQYQVWQDLEEELGEGKGKDALRYAKALAAGATFDEIAEQEGLQGDAAERFKAEVGLLSTTDSMRKAMSKLEGGRMSAGRNVARVIYNNALLDTREGGARILSGSVDAVYSVVADPTIAVGAASKATKAARWGLKNEDGLYKLNRWQKGARLLDQVDSGALTVKEAREAMKAMGGGHRFLTGVVHEMEMVRAPAKAVQEAVKTGNWGRLVEQYPGMARSIDDIMDYNGRLAAANLPTMADDAGQVFEFFKEAAQHQNVLRRADEVAFKYNTKLFGHDGGGHIIVPHRTGTQSKLVAAKLGAKRVLLGRSLDDADILDDATRALLKEADDEAAIEAAKASGVPAEEARALADEMEIDAHTGAYVRKRPNAVQRQLNQLYTLFSEPTVKGKAIHLTGEMAAEEFRAYNESLGIIEGASSMERARRFNQFMNADLLGRHLLIQDMTNKMAATVGLTSTKEGAELMEKYARHQHHIYGLMDMLKSNKRLVADDADDARRLIIRNAIDEGHLSPMMQVPSMREMVIAARKTGVLKRVGGHIRNSHLEAAMTNVWKPGTIMRFGFPLRAGFDEALLHVMRNGSLRYLRTTTLEKWAGIKGMQLDELGNLVRRPEGAIKPIKTLTRTMATVAGGTDEAIIKKAVRDVVKTTEWGAADAAGKRLLEKEAADAALAASFREMKGLPKAFRAISDYYELASLRSSRRFHALTRDAKVMKRSEWANWLLEHSGGTKESRMAYAWLSSHTIAQREQAEVLGHALHGLTPNGSTNGLGDLVRVYSPSSESGWQALPLIKDRNNGWEWAGNDDLSGKYLNMSNRLEKMAEAPSPRAAMYQLRHHVPQKVLDETTAILGEPGIFGLQIIRDDIAAYEDVRKFFARAATSEADADSLLRTAAAMDFSPEELAIIDTYVGHWDNLSLETRQFISDNSLTSSMLTDDWDLVQNRAANAVYNTLRRLENQDNLHSLIRAQIVDNKEVAKPLRRGHTRIYSPMVDRRTADEVERLFRDESMMQSFAERLSDHLNARGLKGQMGYVWGASPVNGDQGYTMASWMAGLKAAIAQGDGSYATALMMGTSNYALAEAVRDALTDILPDKMLRPTVGFYDMPKRSLEYRASGIKTVGGDVVSFQPHHALKFEAIDPDSTLRQVHIQLANGERQWVGENELKLFGRRARMEETKVASTYGSDRMVFFDRNGKQVRFNSKLIDDDFRNDMAFLRGEGGHFSERKAKWTWAEAEYQAEAERFAQVLDSMGLGENVGATLDDMIGWYQTRHMHDYAPLPLQGRMQDEGIWEDFEELASSAVKSGDRTMRTWTDAETVRQSQVAKAAMDELGIDLAELKLTRSQYKALMIEREKAHQALDPAGFGRPRGYSREAIEREKDALSVAFQRSGIDADDLIVTKEVDLTDRIRQAELDGDTALMDQLTEELNALPPKPSSRMLQALAREDNDYRIIGEIWGNGVTEDAAVRRASQHILDEVNGFVVGQESGEVLHTIVGPLLRGEHSMDNLWRKVKLDELPEKVHGPTRLVATGNTWQDFLNRVFDGSFSPIIGAISRSPMFMESFTKSLKTFEHVRSNVIVRELDDAARATLKGIGANVEDLEQVHDILFRHLSSRPELIDDTSEAISRYAKAMWNPDAEGALGMANEALSEMLGKEVRLGGDQFQEIAAWHKNLSHAREAQVDVAVKRATEMVTPYIDDHNLRSAFQEVVGPVVLPFFYAEEQFLRRFARSLYETPQLLRKGQLAMNGLRNIGVIRKDRFGNEYLVLPGSEILMGKIADMATMLTGNDAFQVLDQPLSMRTEFVLPGWGTEQSRWGWGPIIGLSVDKMTQRYPEYEWRSEPPNRSWWQYVVPGPVSGAYKAFVEDIDPAQLGSAQMEAIAYMEAHDLLPDETATAVEKENALADVRQLTRQIGVLRYMTGQVGFTGMTPKDWHADYLADDFQSLLRAGLSVEEAFDRFVELHGKENLGYTVFRTSNEVGAPLPATEAALRFMLENGDDIKNHPASMAWLIPEGKTDGRFDRRAYNQQLALGLRTHKAPEDMLTQIYVKEASEDYFDAKLEYDKQRNATKDRRDAAKGGERERLQRELNEMDASWKAYKDSYMAMHPVFAESFSPEASQRRRETLEELEWMIAAGIGGDQGKKMAPLINAFWKLDRDYRAIKGSSKQAKAMKAEMLDDAFNQMWNYVEENPETRPFFLSVISNELPDAADTMLTDKLNDEVAA